jgi:hypothetical protein
VGPEFFYYLSGLEYCSQRLKCGEEIPGGQTAHKVANIHIFDIVSLPGHHFAFQTAPGAHKEDIRLGMQAPDFIGNNYAGKYVTAGAAAGQEYSYLLCFHCLTPSLLPIP